MSSIEKERLCRWACENDFEEFQNSVFSRPTKGQASYFSDFDATPELEEYDVHTAADISRALDLHLDDRLSDIKKECVISMLKNHRVTEAESEGGETGELPEYIYSF